MNASNQGAYNKVVASSLLQHTGDLTALHVMSLHLFECRPFTWHLFESSTLRGRPDDTLGGMFFFLKKKDCLAKSDEKIVCSTKCKMWKVCSQNWQKNGVIWGNKCACSFAWEENKKVYCFWLRAKTKVCTGEKKTWPPPTPLHHLSHPLMAVRWQKCARSGLETSSHRNKKEVEKKCSLLKTKTKKSSGRLK